MNWDFSKQTKRLNEAVEKSGLTLKELSEQTRISVRTLKDYLTGKRYPRIKLLWQIRKVLNVSFDYLLVREKNEIKNAECGIFWGHSEEATRPKNPIGR